MKYEVEPTQYALRVYEDDATEDYCAVATIRVYGCRLYRRQSYIVLCQSILQG
jgi:hypothetical protein